MPVQVPAEAVSGWEARAVPEMVGGELFVGEFAAATGAVWAEVCVDEPVESVAVTLTAIVEPMSAAVST